MFALKPFQETAISQLKDQFLSLWKLPNQNIPLVFKSPTGSGKTIMLAQFLRDIVSDPRFAGNDVAFVWFSFSEDSYEQSKKKLFDYYGGASELDLLDLNDLSREKLRQNDIFFINWQKIKGRSKESRKLRRDNEQGLTFDNFINETHGAGRKIVVIIDEEHIGSDTDLALEVVEGLIKPKITLRMSATPKYIPTRAETGGYVEIRRDAVVEAGLIKEKIVFQTEEDLQQKAVKKLDQDEMLLELAFAKRLELVELYKKLGVEVNPLVLIQLPNDDQATKETSDTTKQTIVLEYLKRKGVKSDEIAVWLSKEKENLEDLEKANSPVSFLLFKQAAATGWDCPRAGVLVMFREIKNPTFAIQTVGRILRMPFGTHFAHPELNLGYLYTNYKRNEVLAEYVKSKTENRPAINGSYRKKNVEPIKLKSVFMTRADYNDLGDSFQMTFKQVADKKLDTKKLNLKPKVTNGLIVGVEIDDYDNFTKELFEEGGSYDEEMSRHDLERLYNLLCFKIVAKQTDENRKFAPERSWGKLKTALNIYLMEKLKISRADAYKIIVNDLVSSAGALAPVVGDALLSYRPIREQEVNKKAARAKRTEHIEVPREALFFTDQYAELEVKKSAMEPFWFEKIPAGLFGGANNERKFIEFLESPKNKSVVWWHKNGDTGSEHFSISFYNPDENKEKLFYPDWIIKTKNSVLIIDTKAGITAESNDTKYKAEALQAWLKGKKGFDGGIAVQDGPNGWKINRNAKYSHDSSLKGWDVLEL
ncbi:MAG: restriction endonuclease subunit R [Candidatus Niyogibacteria bacterium CG10_big_fil_rev_8_21_14_0_10_46_36]|uniref:Restriction endonuclease subunit R n=1 Tax=Candidatus Niyogibacteria bacterium CG10_big_fil_rev_8_21_14_0_10_46_36 TaxID=1974726 RepID=A0A2H0TEN8_9BACT|nr:MAG: restriction endonuclease subunit R [Candidatus Niyogibacteria bacterium CG10_big_fil_rev_8_21_14_0_10_46_36]